MRHRRVRKGRDGAEQQTVNALDVADDEGGESAVHQFLHRFERFGVDAGTFPSRTSRCACSTRLVHGEAALERRRDSAGKCYWLAIAAQLSAQRRQASAQRFISLSSPMRAQDSAHLRQTSAHAQIGRAYGRERVWQGEEMSGVARSLK